jgi:nicotinamidase-related amidase
MANPRISNQRARSNSHEFTERDVLELAKQAYEKNPVFDIKPEKCALLVIDMQDEFVRPHWTPFWVPEATRQVPHIKRLLEFCRKKGISVIFTVFARTHNYFDRPLTGKFMSNRYGELGSKDPSWFRNGNVWHEIAPLEGEIVIQKPSYGAFYDTPLETILKNLEKDTVIICGTLTNFCCGTTARQAYERGFKVVIGSDVTSTDDPALHEAELKTLRKGFAMVLSADEIIERLRV